MISRNQLQSEALKLAMEFNRRQLFPAETASDAKRHMELNQYFYEVIMLWILEKAKECVIYDKPDIKREEIPNPFDRLSGLHRDWFNTIKLEWELRLK